MALKRIYTYADGLPGNDVASAQQDSKGYMWFACKNNLCRFDGKTFQVFNHKTSGLKNIPIAQPMFDGRSGIIIVYDYFYPGINTPDVIDINTLEVKSFKEYYPTCPVDPANIFVHIYPRFKFFHRPANGQKPDLQLLYKPQAWTLDANGTFKEQNTIAVRGFEVKNIEGRKQLVLSNIKDVRDIEGKCLIQYSDSTRYEELGSTTIQLEEKDGYVFSVNIDTRVEFYYTTYDGKVTHLGTDTARYKNYLFDKRDNHMYWDKKYFAPAVKPNGNLVVFSSETGELPVIDSTSGDNIRKAKLNKLNPDRYNRYWMSTSEGVVKITVTKKLFQNFYSLKMENEKGNNAVRNLFRDREHEVYSLTDYVVIGENGKRKKLRNEYNFSSLFFNGELLLGSKQLKRYNTKTGQLEHIVHSPGQEIWSMHPLNDSCVLLGCTYNLDMYNANTKTITRLSHKEYPSANFVYRITTESSGRIVAVANNGIFFLNNRGTITEFISTTEKDKKGALPFTGINDLYIDKEGIYWLATVGDGLYRWDKKNNTFENFEGESGFISNKLCRIEEDGNNNLWISTNFGLACFNKKTLKAHVYTTSNGLENNEFNRSSSFKDENGLMYFGTTDGFTVFNPNDFNADTAICNYPLNLTSFNVYNAATNLSENIDLTKPVELTDGRKNLSLSVLLMDLEEINHLYSYQVIGLSDEKKFFRDETVSITDLPYGDYTVVISAQCLNGTWNKTQIQIPISVIKPLYKRWWFIFLIITLLIAVIYFYIRYRLSRIQKENEKLETIVSERTQELSQSLSEQTALLQEVHHRVKNNLQFMAAILQMQIRSIQDESNQAVLKETYRRINSMSLVHEMLYNKDKLEYIEVKDYLNELISKLNSFVYEEQKEIKFETDIEDFKFNVNDCVALGMITSEIISNSIKYAFENINNPVIYIKLEKAGEQFVFTIGDNGKGMKQKKEGGLGLRLIDIFARQLEATYEIKEKNGLMYIFKFSSKDHGDRI